MLRGGELLALANPADTAIEAVRSLRTTMHFAMLDARNNIIMISGTSPDIGKTFISTNLAAVMAQSGQRVLFIDGDMRKGYSTSCLTAITARVCLTYCQIRRRWSRRFVRPTSADSILFRVDSCRLIRQSC